MSGEASHEELWAVCHVHGRKYESWPGHDLDPPTGQCFGCRWFHELAGGVPDRGYWEHRNYDWGVCFDATGRSPRLGLLTYEHQGCLAWQPTLPCGEGRHVWMAYLQGQEICQLCGETRPLPEEPEAE